MWGYNVSTAVIDSQTLLGMSSLDILVFVNESSSESIAEPHVVCAELCIGVYHGLDDDGVAKLL